MIKRSRITLEIFWNDDLNEPPSKWNWNYLLDAKLAGKGAKVIGFVELMNLAPKEEEEYNHRVAKALGEK